MFGYVCDDVIIPAGAGPNFSEAIGERLRLVNVCDR